MSFRNGEIEAFFSHKGGYRSLKNEMLFQLKKHIFDEAIYDQ